MTTACHNRAPADQATCFASLLALSAEDWKTIKRFAVSRTYALHAVRYEADAEDLLHEAIARTLEGSRKWKPQKVGLVAQLKGCVRSIAGTYEGKGRRRSGKLPDELRSATGEQLYQRALLGSMRRALEPQALALNIFDLLLEGHPASAIQTILSIDRKTYGAARRRMILLLRANFAA